MEIPLKLAEEIRIVNNIRNKVERNKAILNLVLRERRRLEEAESTISELTTNLKQIYRMTEEQEKLGKDILSYL